MRFSANNFSRLQTEATNAGVSLRAVVFQRIQDLARAWPNVRYTMTEEQNKKRLFMDVSEYPLLSKIACAVGCGIPHLGDVIATFEVVH